MPNIYVYAELLLNIRQVTVIAILPSSCNETTHIELDSDHVILRLRHEDEGSSIGLPCPVLNDANVKVPTIPTKELSFRLAVSGSSKLPGRTRSLSDDTIPWPASALTSETQLACGSCGNLLVTDVKVWKDLPSGGWADMMDFWHCHKPTIEDTPNGSAGSTKGYAASNVLGPTTGVGLVDISCFHVADSDGTGICSNIQQVSLECSSCHKIIGTRDEKNKSLRLFKWSTSVRQDGRSTPETCSVQEIISAQLLALREEQAVHKFLVHGGNIDEVKDALLLWIFTPDLLYSTSTSPPQRAMKVFYTFITNPSAVLEKQSVRIEELEIPSYALEHLQSDLKASTSMLPPSAQQHQTWTIGLLHRFPHS